MAGEQPLYFPFIFAEAEAYKKQVCPLNVSVMGKLDCFKLYEMQYVKISLVEDFPLPSEWKAHGFWASRA